MSNERPTSASVVGWFFIIIGCLSVITGIGYIVVSVINGNSLGSALLGFVQIAVAGFVAYAGYGLLRGLAIMRRALEILSYLLVILFAVFGVNLARDFSSWGLLVSSSFCMILFVFVIRELRSQKIQVYASKT